MHGARSTTLFSRSHWPWALALALAACPHPDERLPRDEGDASEEGKDTGAGAGRDSPSATHSGLISLQHVAIHGLPEAGEGLTLQALFTRATKPLFDEQPGAPTGCKAYWYELPNQPPPVLEDHGAVRLQGLVGGDLTCAFEPTRGYTCNDGSAPDASVRYLQRAFAPNMPVRVSLVAGGERRFDASDSEVRPGDGFVLDDASRALISDVPLDGRPLTLGCSGAGGSCGEAQASIVRITTTDAELSGLPSTAMPSSTRRYVEISCASLGAGNITVPEAAMQLLRRAREQGALSRVRTAFMRDGIALVANAPPAAPNRLVIAAGRALLGFTDVPR